MAWSNVREGAVVAAQLDVVTIGYAGSRVASTCTLVRDGDVVVVVDPGMVASRELLTDPLETRGLSTTDVTDVVISHHHPDHTMNIALFPNARVHDFATTYERDLWLDRQPGDFQLSPNIRLTPTPGHTDQDVTTLVSTQSGLVALTHLWWYADGPDHDPFAPDQDVLRASRERILRLAPSLIVPGHGAPFVPPR
jgi:glyoxylase-like metal-dependent hydrolase (beta-lactamase superfamily II)